MSITGSLRAAPAGAPPPRPRTTTARPLLFVVMAVCCGATVANVYLAQPLLELFAHLPQARSRANTVYMVAAFLSGAVCAALAAACYGTYGWPGVCALQALLAGAALLVLPAIRRHDQHHRPQPA